MGVIVRYLFVRGRGQEGQEKLSGPLELEFHIQGSQDTWLPLYCLSCYGGEVEGSLEEEEAAPYLKGFFPLCEH